MYALSNIAIAVLICSLALGDCAPTSQNNNNNNNNNQLQTSFDCDMCEFIMYTVDTYLTLNSTDEDIAKVVSEICNYVPSEYSQFVSHTKNIN